MKLEQYRKETPRTLADLGNMHLNSLHMTVGMMTELTEIVECFVKLGDAGYDMINLGEEVADAMWYMSNYATIQEVEFETLSFDDLLELAGTQDEFVAPFDLMFIFAGRLLDYDKKMFAYGKFYNPDLKQDNFAGLWSALQCFCHEYDIDLEDCMEKNIAKLRARFPEKFTSEHAINRDLVKERQILES